MRLSLTLSVSFLCVAILTPDFIAAIKIAKIFDYSYYLRHYRKQSDGPVANSNREKLFLGSSLGIFKHNIKFLQRKSNYFLAQSAMMDLTPNEIEKRQGPNPDLDLKPVQEAEELGDLPANYLMSVQKLTDDLLEDGSMAHNDQQGTELIGSNDLKKSLNDAIEDYMSAPNFGKLENDAERASANMRIHLDNMQEDYLKPMTMSVNEQAVKVPKKKDQTEVHKISDPSEGVRSESADSIMSSFTDSVSNLLFVDDEPTDEIASSFSDSVRDLLMQAGGETDKKLISDVSDVMNPKRSPGSIKYNVDWRITGCISAPKSQGACNACYIFATIDLLEYFYCRQTRTKSTFSSQHILDCGRRLGKIKGCQGGRMSEVGQFIRYYGLRLESDHPYTGEHGQCKSLNQVDSGAVKTDIVNWELFDSITAWFTWVRKSPVLVGINMPDDFHIYGGGIHDGQNCNIKETHAMLLVGSGIQDGVEFWLLKNSFSEDWGEKGYFRISKSAKLNCFGSVIVARANFNQ